MVLIGTAALASAPNPYSLPAQLRAAVAVTTIRSDNTVSWSRGPGGVPAFGELSTVVLMYRTTEQTAVFVRGGAALTGSAGRVTGQAANPVMGAMASLMPIEGLRLAPYLSLTLPLGTGSPRYSMDSTLLATGDFGIAPGLDASFSRSGFTVQAEATLVQLISDQRRASSTDAFKTNFGAALHVGYFVVPWMTLLGELRFQRWLTTPTFVAATWDTRQNVTVAGGVRFQFRVGRTWFKPGLTYIRGLDDPMARTGQSIVQADLPIVF